MLRNKLLLLAVGLIVVLATLATVPAAAQVTPFLGEIRYVGFNFAPQGWALCNGQLLSIADNTALFTLLGTFYGGDGKTTFALPDMRGRVPVATGQGLNLTNRFIGSTGGQESVTLTGPQMPKHRHALKAVSGVGNSKAPSGNALANSSTVAIYSSQAPDVTLEAASMTSQGSNQPHENMQPFLAVTCIIALQGIYPTQN
jgi:microcystin-dependent protein